MGQTDNHASHASGRRAAEPPPVGWYDGSPSDVLARLTTDLAGLSGADAAARLARFGPNILPRPEPPGLIRIFLRQFKNPLVYLLVVATLVSLLVEQYLDAVFIFVVLLFNAAIGTVQEWQAQKKATELDRLVPRRAVVRRDGRWEDVDTATLVPGDIVKLETGTQVSADLRLMSNRELLIDESLLTGESVAVEKSADAVVAGQTPLAGRTNMLFAGTTMLAGRATAAVVATAQGTEIGKIAASLAYGAARPPPLVRKLDRFSRVIGVATVVLIGLIAAALSLQGTPLVTVFLVAIALAVAAIPEGLPVAITVALAIATNRMQRRNVIVRSLPAVEGLGACTVIASDKTGTLTCNELTVKAVTLFKDGKCGPTALVDGLGFQADGKVLVDGRSPDSAASARLREIAISAALCNEASYRRTDQGAQHHGDTVDVAFLVLAGKVDLDTDALKTDSPIVTTIPYEPERRFAAAFARQVDQSDGAAEGAVVAHVKGAAEVVAAMCADLDDGAVRAEVERLAGAGHRVLAIARGPVVADDLLERPAAALDSLEFLGLAGLIDPIRPEVPDAVARCAAAGISVRMITGDHPTTALAIARQLGIAESRAAVAEEREIRDLVAHPQALDRFVADKRVFARVEPVQKLAIVEAFQRCGHVVAVTGDGVNDAPAINTADIGVAMGRGGTDVARDAADLVLADDNFASIVGGVEEGRVAYDNVRKLIFLLIATGLGEIVLFLLAIAFDLPLPLYAAQLLWLNLVTNGIQDIALAFEKGEAGIGHRPPRPPGERIFDLRMCLQVAVAGGYIGVIGCAAYAWFLSQGMAVEDARNLVLLLMVLFENAQALNARSERLSVFRVPLSANWFLIAAVIGAQGLHIGAMFLPGLSTVLGTKPVGLLDWILIAALAASLILVMEGYKHATERFFNNARRPGASAV